MLVEVNAVHEIPELPKPYILWNESVPFPIVEEIPLLDAVTHVIVHRATMGEYQFLHGAAIIQYQGELIASWANSLVQENSPSEVQRARRSRDGGFTWSDVEVIAPGFAGPQRHSHGVFAVQQGQLWAVDHPFGRGVCGGVIIAPGIPAWFCQATIGFRGESVSWLGTCRIDLDTPIPG